MQSPTPAEDPARVPAGPPRKGIPRRGGPSVLDLVRLSPDPVFPPGGEALYRTIALLTDLRAGQEVLDVACGRGIKTTFLAAHYGIEGVGIDFDPLLVEEAEQRARSLEVDEHLTFQCADPEDLPFRSEVFDVTIGEVGLSAFFDPAATLRELARVTRPMGAVVLVQLVWTGHVEEDRREHLVRHLGARPLLLVEWKQHLRDAGCVDLHVEDWSDYSSPFRPAVTGPFHDLAQIFTLRQKITILRRARQRWGWRGVRGALVREQEIHRLLTRQRVLGLSLIIGTKWTNEEEAAEDGGH
jgi:SAM-dependent methyltransferase